jgi:hypothetical protein
LDLSLRYLFATSLKILFGLAKVRNCFDNIKFIYELPA